MPFNSVSNDEGPSNGAWGRGAGGGTDGLTARTGLPTGVDLGLPDVVEVPLRRHVVYRKRRESVSR